MISTKRWRQREEQVKLVSKSVSAASGGSGGHDITGRIADLGVFFAACTQRIGQASNSQSFEQGSTEWLACKQKCITGSIAAKLVGHSPFKGPIEALDSMFGGGVLNENGEIEEEAVSYRGRRAMLHGTKTEPVARTAYLAELRESMRKVMKTATILFDVSMETGEKVEGSGHVWFRGHRIDLRKDEKGWAVPVIEIKHLGDARHRNGFWLDRSRPWQGASFDGQVLINGIFRWLVEIKCPFPDPDIEDEIERDPVHILWRTIYYDQVMLQLHVARVTEPQVNFCDTYIYTEKYGSYLEPFYYDAEYVWTWMLPRMTSVYMSQGLRSLRPVNGSSSIMARSAKKPRRARSNLPEAKALSPEEFALRVAQWKRKSPGL